MAKKQWYIIKKKSARSWAAYELAPGQIDNLKRGYEYRGPFKGFVQCLVASGEEQNKHAKVS